MTLILADTNIIFPQLVWDLYKDHLSKTESTGKLIFNTSIPESILEKTIFDSEKIYSEFQKQMTSKNIEKIYLTQEIQKQVFNLHNNMKLNIEQRKNMHLFAQFSKLAPDTQKEIDEKVYIQLRSCEEKLDNLFGITQEYTTPNTATYFIINEFVRALKDDFFDLTKEKHNFDYGADLQLATTAIYESVVNGNKPQIISNDNDILNMISASYVVLHKARHTLKDTDYNLNLQNRDVMPELSKISLTGVIESIDLMDRGNEILIFPGYEGFIDSTKKSGYNSVVGKFATFLSNYTNRLKETNRKVRIDEL